MVSLNLRQYFPLVSFIQVHFWAVKGWPEASPSEKNTAETLTIIRSKAEVGDREREKSKKCRNADPRLLATSNNSHWKASY